MGFVCVKRRMRGAARPSKTIRESFSPVLGSIIATTKHHRFDMYESNAALSLSPNLKSCSFSQPIKPSALSERTTLTSYIPTRCSAIVSTPSDPGAADILKVLMARKGKEMNSPHMEYQASLPLFSLNR